jgi:hypothetical protein
METTFDGYWTAMFAGTGTTPKETMEKYLSISSIFLIERSTVSFAESADSRSHGEN